jgi:hypothetical protein
MAAGLEISADDLAGRFRLDAFVVERLLEAERGRPQRAPTDDPGIARGPTREMVPATGSGVVD